MERYFIYNCLGQMVGNCKGYATYKGANMVFNRRTMQVMLIDLAHAHKVQGSSRGSVLIGSIKLECVKMNTESQEILAAYHNQECPDCGTPIPHNVEEGEECKNCGHAFFPYTPCDDQE